MKKVKSIVVSNIQWDAPKSVQLPEEITIDIDEDNEYLLEDIDGYAEELCDYLSDEHGYCLLGFAVELIDE